MGCAGAGGRGSTQLGVIITWYTVSRTQFLVDSLQEKTCPRAPYAGGHSSIFEVGHGHPDAPPVVGVGGSAVGVIYRVAATQSNSSNSTATPVNDRPHARSMHAERARRCVLKLAQTPYVSPLCSPRGTSTAKV